MKHLTENGMPVVPIDFEGLCVKIPVREMTLTEWPANEPIPKNVKIQIGRMLGATIDFIPAGVDFKAHIAVGSRKAATMLKECISEYKRGKDRLTTGEYPIDPIG